MSLISFAHPEAQQTSLPGFQAFRICPFDTMSTELKEVKLRQRVIEIAEN